MLKKEMDEAITAEATWGHLGKSSMEELFMTVFLACFEFTLPLPICFHHELEKVLVKFQSGTCF